MLHIITGPMFSGKTTTLSSKLTEKSLYINHSLDTRGNLFYSHDKNVSFKVKCVKTDKLTDDLVEGYDVIGVDEAQFFDDIMKVVDWVENGKIVYVAGLHSDYKREKFGKIMDLIPLSDSLTMLKAKCKCGKDAMFSKRKKENNDQILVGSIEYEPVCRKC